MYLYFGILLLVLFFFYCLNCWRRRKIICKIKSLCMGEKCEMLDELIAPFGYSYLQKQDIFTSRIDAWQRDFGYCALYDDKAIFLNMDFDCLPVYFNFHNRTWLIEFWKGQYGINTGCEIGVYHADRILNEKELKHTLFHSVENNEMPELALTLSGDARNQRTQQPPVLARVCGRHWWLTAFRMGCFSRPADLSLRVSVTLQSPEMAEAFLRGLLNAGYNRAEIQLCRCTVTFTFAHVKHPQKPCWLRRFWIRIVQWSNRLWCKVYLRITRPFHLSVDRILYLYYYLPFAFRKMLRLKRFKKRPKGIKWHSNR